MEVQSVTFYKSNWTPFKARMWLTKNGYKIKKIDITDNMIRFRQNPPSLYDDFATQQLDNGINLVLGKRRSRKKR